MAIIKPNNNTISAITALPAAITTGKVLQIQTATKTDAASTTSSSYEDISGMSVSITPASSSNKILILTNLGLSSSGTERSDKIRILRDSTAIVDPANLFRLTNTNSHMYNASFNYLDSPSSTSAVTYKCQWMSESGAFTAYLNRRGNDSTLFTASTITVMEIAA